jgi:hypothetical protein
MVVSFGTCNDCSAAWRTGLRRVRRLSRDSHRIMIPLIANCLPLFETICLRFLNFITSCANNDSHLLRFIMQHSVQVVCMFSPIGKNYYVFANCADQFRFTSEDLNMLTRPVVIADR